MEANNVSQRLFKEMLRLKSEHKDLKSCNVPILLSALYEVRGEDKEEFANLFCEYFEKKLKVKPEINRKAFDKLISKSLKNTSTKADTKEKILVWDEEEHTVAMDDELYQVFEEVEAFMLKNSKTVMTPEYFWIVLFENENSTAHKFVREVSANFMDAQNFFSSSKILGYEVIPYELSSFLTNKVSDKTGCDIVGRDDVLNEIYRVMLKTSKRNALLYGYSGVGKTAVLEKFEYQIVNKQCPPAFAHFQVFELSVKDFILECDTNSKANEKMNTLMEFLRRRKEDIILVIDEIQIILGKGGLFDNKIDISAVMKPILSLGEVRIVGVTTMEDMVSFVSDAALSRRFETILVKEPKIKEVKDMILPRINKLVEKKEVYISDKLIEKAVWYATCYEFNKNNPDKTIDVIDRAMANTKMNGRTEVTHQDLLDVFEISHKIWNGMSYITKRCDSYHESGHYMVNRLTNQGDVEILAVSIMPTEDYMGINILEIVEDVIPELNRQYYINEIACDLAGRVAEQMIGSENNAGAAADLKQASRVAEKMVTELGLSSGKVYSNRSYWDDSMGNTEKVTKEIDAEINKAIKEATKLAEKLLTENEDILHALAEALLQNHIMMAEELDEVWQKTVNARKNSNVNTSGKIKHSKKKTKNVAQKIRKAIRKRKAQKVHYSKKP